MPEYLSEWHLYESELSMKYEEHLALAVQSENSWPSLAGLEKISL